MMNRMFERIIALAIIILVGVGCYYWSSYESDVSSDAQTLAFLGSVRGGLATYAQQYAAYPAIDDPFVKRFDSSHTIYRPLAEDGVSECKDHVRCPRYELSFSLRTNAYFPKGPHSANQDGIQ